jgi:hypothetical protein
MNYIITNTKLRAYVFHLIEIFHVQDPLNRY